MWSTPGIRTWPFAFSGLCETSNKLELILFANDTSVFSSGDNIDTLNYAV